MTAEERECIRHEKALNAAVMHLEKPGGQFYCGRSKVGGLSWSTDSVGEFIDREGSQCKGCRRAAERQLPEWFE